MKSHVWAIENLEEYERCMDVRNHAMRRANIQKVIREEGMLAAQVAYDHVMSDHSVPEPSTTIVCLNGCGADYTDENRMGPCDGTFLSGQIRRVNFRKEDS